MKDFWNKLEENLIVVFMALVTLLILAGWICKYVAPDSVKAMNQMAMIAYAWIVFLAIAYSAKKGLFMKLDVISSALLGEDEERPGSAYECDSVSCLLVFLCAGNPAAAGNDCGWGGL